MDDKLAQATLNALARQREAALNGCAQLEAQLELVNAENRALKEQLAKLQPLDVDPDHLKADGQALSNGQAPALN